jgi:hypothetical protein
LKCRKRNERIPSREGKIYKNNAYSKSMEYSNEKIKELLRIYHNLYSISEAPNASILYINFSLDSLRTALQSAKEFPKEIYIGEEGLEETIKKSTLLIEQAIGYHEEELGIKETKQEKKPNNPFLNSINEYVNKQDKQ